MSPIIISLREILKEARIGFIGFGTSRDEVRQALGDPEDWRYGQRMERSDLWKYGNLQLWFESDELTFLGIYFRFPDDILHPNFSMTGFFPTHNTSRREIEDYLRMERLAFEVFEPLTFGDQISLLVESHMNIVFVQAINEESTIDSIQLHRV